VDQEAPQLAADPHVGKDGRRLVVVVPEIVMHFLEVPLAHAGFQIERDDRNREQVVAAALAAVRVWRRVADRQIHESEFRIDGGV
jgi:hypothetical protein